MLPLLAAITGNLIWGFSYIFTRVALFSAPPDVLLSIRFIAAFIILNGMLLAGKATFSIKEEKKKKNLKYLLGLGFMECIFFYFESYGILYSNASFASVILAVVPVISVGLAAMFLGEKPTVKQVFFCVVPVVGVIIMTITETGLGVVTPLGVILLLCTCFTSGFYKILNRKSSFYFNSFERTYVVLAMSVVVFTISAFKAVDWSLKAYLEPLGNPVFVAMVLILAVFCSVVAGLMVNYAAARISVLMLSTIGTLSTVCTVIAGVVILHEPMNTAIFIGTAMIILGIWQVTKPPKMENNPVKKEESSVNEDQ